MWPAIQNIPGFTSATPTSKVMHISAMSKKSAFIMNDTAGSMTATSNSSSYHSSNGPVSRKELVDLYDSSESRNPIAFKEVTTKKKMSDVHSAHVETTKTIIDKDKSGHLAVLNHFISTGERHLAYSYLICLGSPDFQQ